ncbi:VCBS domain-containing protein, partial [Halomonas sp. V046]|uniref:VCBS domain-containing protein n=1 Tax=Halomonas sp. V046 TaxID=3459611 RepID=UPI004043C844
AAVDDAASVGEDASAAITGEVLGNDVGGADGKSFVAFDSPTAHYGSFTDNGDGSWSYRVDSTAQAVQSLDTGETLTETFRYTLTDSDGSTDTATLTVTITGSDDGAPTVTIPDGNGSGSGAEAGHHRLVEASGESVSASMTVGAEAGIAAVTVAGKDVTTASATAPVTLSGSYGTLTITGFDAAS